MKANFKSKSLLSVAENILNSAASFLISIFLINTTNPEIFGQFNIAFISMTLALSVGTALFNNQIALLSAKKTGAERERIINTLSVSYHFLNFIFSFCLFLVVDYVLDWGFGFFLFSYSFLYNYRENVKTICYLNDLNHKAFHSTAMLFVFILIFIGVLYIGVIDFSVSNFLFLISISYFASCYVFIGHSSFKSSLNAFDLEQLYNNFAYSKWSLAAGLAAWGQSNAYAYLIAYYHGALFVAYIYATRLVMMPMNVLVTGIFSGVKSQLSAEYETEKNTVRTKVFTIYFSMSIAVFFYSVFCWYFWSYIDSYFFSGKYQDISYLILLWGLYFSMQSIRVGITNYMQLGLHFKQIGVVSIPAYIVSIMCIAVSAAYLPFYYTLLVMSIFEFVMFLVLVLRSRKCL